MGVVEGNRRGSVWRRWDPHIHAPGTVLNDQFVGDGSFEEYLARIDGAHPVVECVGVTDYLSTACYERVVEARKNGALPNVTLVYPNVEMRLSIGTKKNKGINLHLLVSPDDPEHLSELHRFLHRLTFSYKTDKFQCSDEDLARLGKRHDPGITDEKVALRVGVNQFKVDFNELRREFRESLWMQANCLVAVAGSSSDGTAGLQAEGAGFAAVRKEIEAFGDIVFSASDKQIAYWSGQGAIGPEEIVEEYGGLKPCLHGSDAHCLEEVAEPDLDRMTWIKGDPAFESLRQVCYEPLLRVFIGSSPPDHLSPERAIQLVATNGAPWLLDDGLEINSGLVAIIGARGSGKTALADLLAHGGGSAVPVSGVDSFVHRASSLLAGVVVELTWNDNAVLVHALSGPPLIDESGVHYLSQQFVERLCSSEGANDELLAEIQKVVFASHPPASRLGSTSFSELLEQRLGDNRLNRNHLREQLDRISEQVLSERMLKRALPVKAIELQQLDTRLEADRAARLHIVQTGQKQRTDYYERLRTVIEERERELLNLRRRRQAIDHLEREVERHRVRVLPDLASELQRQFETIGLSADEWREFSFTFDGDPVAVVGVHRQRLDDAIEMTQSGNPAIQAAATSSVQELRVVDLDALRNAFEGVAAKIGIDQKNARQLAALNKRISVAELDREKLQRELVRCNGADARLHELAQERSARYRDFFELIIAEAQTLHELYEPLAQRLQAAGDSVGLLRLTVIRHVNVESWAQRGEELLDLRKQGKFKGRGALAGFARERLVPAWEVGSADDVAAAMTAFRQEYDAALLAQASFDNDAPEYHQWTLDVGRWLYSTDHISVTYSFEYDGVPLGQLSPGNRGIVLLLLYLALDTEDQRPLIIDQPEENLDPRSVFAELVGLFRHARSRRQVIIVTHNANLVVNADVDQVIVASCMRGDEGSPPSFHYRAGSLENGAIRAEVCEILEGGEAAFRERARRLRVSDY